MNKSIILCGVGGQGTVLASKLIATAAADKNIPVMSAETIGMAQKGGSVFSHLKIGDGIYSPMIGKGEADIIVAFEPAEAVRMLPYLKKDGAVIVNSNPVMPTTAALGGSDYNGMEMIDYLKQNIENITVVDCSAICEKLGSPMVMNMILLGCAVRTGETGLELDDIKRAVRKKVKPQFYEINILALEAAE